VSNLLAVPAAVHPDPAVSALPTGRNYHMRWPHNVNSQPCPLCGHTQHQVLYDLSRVDRPHGIPGLIVCCEACGFWFKIPTISMHPHAAYQSEYAEDQATAQCMLSEHARQFFRKVLRGLGVKTGRLLDMGTGLGGCVEEALSLGYQAQGVDLCEPLVRKARLRGLDVECKAAEHIQTSGVFDVITVLDLIEHVPEPLALLDAARRALKPNGELVVYTPNHRAAVVLLARWLYVFGFRFPVSEIFAGNHLGFFDDRTLLAALRKARFEICRLEIFPYDPSRPGQYCSPISLAAVAAIEQVGRPFGRMFRLLAYARKRR
jgi:2-polyprenyl-3-methyl-5-hydroxy-6-metoxy-1,4-benzoquinol methylase